MSTFGRWCEIVAIAAGLAAPLALIRAPSGAVRARWCLAVAAAASLLAVGALGVAFLRSDFSLVYVTDQSRVGASAPIRFAGIWAGMEGSLLLWGATAAVIGLLASLWSASGLGAAVAERSAGVAGAVVAAIVGMVLRWADPFALLEIPAVSGRGLTPILEHPAMAYHPPLLYLGVVGFLGAYVVTVAAASLGALDGKWFAWVRRSMLAAWTVTTLGLVTGANWAYVELGWGGYWAWDPVENSALVPWLAATGFLHVGRTTVVRRPALGAVLAAAPFVLVAAGAAATRSGALNSVHGFAEAAVIGRSLAILAFAVALLPIMALGMSMLGASGSEGTHASRPPRTRARQLQLGGAMTIFFATAIVALGTVWPVFFDDGRIIGGRFFTSILGPLAVAGVAIAAWAPQISTRSHNGRSASRYVGLGVALVGAVAVLVGSVVAGWPVAKSGVLLASATAAAALGIVGTFRRSGGRAVIAHLGMAVLLIGVAGSTAGSETSSRGIEVGERISLAGYSFENRGIRTDDGPVRDSTRVIADIALLRGDREITVLTPQLVSYGGRGQVLAETALRSRPLDDVQIVLERATDDGLAIITVRVTPLVQLVWWGSLLTAVGGLVALLRPRKIRR